MPADVVYENAEAKAFRDIHPKAPVHILVIPKAHIASVAELTEADDGVVAALLRAAKDAARSAGLVGYKLLFNVGRDAGQMVDHLHLHILGGWGKNGKVKSLDV